MATPTCDKKPRVIVLGGRYNFSVSIKLHMYIRASTVQIAEER